MTKKNFNLKIIESACSREVIILLKKIYRNSQVFKVTESFFIYWKECRINIGRVVRLAAWLNRWSRKRGGSSRTSESSVGSVRRDSEGIGRRELLCRCNYAERPGDKFEITLEWPFMVSQLLRGMRYICGNTILRGRRFVSGELAKESLVDIENSGYRSSCLCWCRPWLTILSEYEVLQGLGDPLSHQKKKRFKNWRAI